MRYKKQSDELKLRKISDRFFKVEDELPGRYRLETFEKGKRRYVILRWGWDGKETKRESIYLGEYNLFVRSLLRVDDLLNNRNQKVLWKMAEEAGLMEIK